MADSVNSKPSDIRPSSPPPRDGVRRYNVNRSCIRCHGRKIRCDRSAPCSACVKSGNAGSCHYPGPARIKRRPRKQITSTIVEQVERLEQLVSDTCEQNVHPDQSEQNLQDSTSSLEQKSSDGGLGRGSSNFTGLLVKDGNLVRYINDRVLSHILGKEEEIRSAVTSPYVSSSANTPCPTARPFSLLHTINQVSYEDGLDGLHPTRRRAIQLWQIFLLNVDPITRLLHKPTIQPMVYAAINEPTHVSSSFRALLFAIYFSALTSTLGDEDRTSLGEEHPPELEQFQRGMEISLSQGDFLDQPNMHSLQAATIFIGAFRSFGSGRSIWTINGTIIRAGQLMGIHRNGKHFNLSPYDQEMRHRLWWRIVTTDSRTLEDQGVWITGNSKLGDARMPLNIDDSDINPNTTTMPSERIGFTEMTPLVSICHIQVAGEAVAQLSLCADVESYSRKLPAAQETISRIRSELEARLFCDYNAHIPIQRLFRDGTKMILDKLEWRCQEGLFRHQQQAEPQGSQRDRQDSAKSDELFRRACDLLDASLDLISNELYASFAWHSSSYLPYEILTFVLWRLYMNPTGSLADTAWYTVSETFSAIERASIVPDKGVRWTILCKLKERVASFRAETQDRAELTGAPNTEPFNEISDRDGREQNIDGGVLLNERNWDPEDLFFSTDWGTFQENLNMDGMMWHQL